jgi:hypothetical protein
MREARAVNASNSLTGFPDTTIGIDLGDSHLREQRMLRIVSNFEQNCGAPWRYT